MSRHKNILLSLALLATTGGACAQNYTGTWYNAAESGWGLNVVHQGDVLFPTWFTYDTDRKPLWMTVSGAVKQADGSYVGDVYRVKGVPFNQINGVASREVIKVGSAKLSFANLNSLSFSYTINNLPTQSKTMTRLPLGTSSPVCEFTTGSRAGATNYSDIWWNPAESGWGINIFHQDNILFSNWYTYNSTGRDQWYVVPRAERQTDGSYKGDIFEVPDGTPYNQINGAPAFAAGVPKSVGQMVYRFTNGERASITYTIGTITQTKSIERQQFGNPAQICRNGTVEPAGGGGNSDGKCYFVLQAGQSRRTRSTTTNGPTDSIERGIGAGTFEGQPVLIWDGFDAQDRRTNRQYARIHSDGTYENIALETFDPATGLLQTRGRYSSNRFPLNLAVGQSFSYSYTLTQNTIATGAQMLINYEQNFVRRANESVTVPAGTFEAACKLDTTTNSSTTTSGFTVTTNSVGPVWINGQVGSLKTTLTSSANAGGFITPLGTQTSELVEFRNN